MQRIETVRTGKRPAAEAALDECDAEDLHSLVLIEKNGLKGDWRRAAVAKRIHELECESCPEDECEGGNSCPKDEEAAE
jgi:hypothetical protein